MYWSCSCIVSVQYLCKNYCIWPDNLQVELLCGSLYGANSDFVDWRQFIVCAAQPWPHPSAQDLVDAMQRFSCSQNNTATAKDSVSSALSKPLWVSREQYMATDIWLTRGEGPQSGSEREGTDRDMFDRNQKLKEVCIKFCIVSIEFQVWTKCKNIKHPMKF